jgi:hypothetical protein
LSNCSEKERKTDILVLSVHFLCSGDVKMLEFAKKCGFLAVFLSFKHPLKCGQYEVQKVIRFPAFNWNLHQNKKSDILDIYHINKLSN